MKTKWFQYVIFVLVLSFTNVLAQSLTITGQTISNRVTWSGVVNLEGDVTVAPSGELIILPGTRVVFLANMDRTRSGRDKTRTELIIKGNLTVRGNIDNKIWFTSSSTAPRMQDWYGIQISNPNHTAVLEYTVVEYAYNGITIKKCDPQINNCQLQFNYNAGLTVELGASPRIIGNIISENGYAGIICNTGAKPIFTDNMITKNEIGLISFGTAQPNLGNATRGENYNVGRNGLFENRAYNIHNHSVRDILAENVSWGTNDMGAISENIYDYDEERKYGRVDVLPILGGTLDIEQKIILSQATVNRSSLAQADNLAPQRPVTNQAGQGNEFSAVGQSAVGPGNEPADTLRLAVVENVAPLTAERTDTRTETVSREESAIDYNQVFLDAFLDENSMILKKVRPVVDDPKRGQRMHGKVIVRVIVDRMGNVESANVLRGLNSYYDRLAKAAAMDFKFKAGTVKGNPIRFSTSIFFEF